MLEACSLIDIKVTSRGKDDSVAIIKISEEVSSILDKKNPILVTPLNLPILVKPKN